MLLFISVYNFITALEVINQRVGNSPFNKEELLELFQCLHVSEASGP